MRIFIFLILALVIPFAPAHALMCFYDTDADRPTVKSIEKKADVVFTGTLEKKQVEKNIQNTVLIFKILKVQKGSYKKFQNIEVVGLVTGFGGSQKYEEGKIYTVAVRRAEKDEKAAAPFVNVADLCEIPVIVKAHQTQDSYSIKNDEGTWLEKLMGK